MSLKLKWTESQYNSSRAALPGGIILNANWAMRTQGQNGYYEASFNGNGLVTNGEPSKFDSMDEAKQAAENAARRILQKGLSILGNE